MIIKIKINNVWALIHEDISDFQQSSLGVNIDVNYLQEWIGDSGMGPGSALMDIKTMLNRVQIFKTEYAYKNKGH